MNGFIGKKADFNQLKAVWGKSVGVSIRGAEGDPCEVAPGMLIVTLDKKSRVERYDFQQETASLFSI